MFALCPTLSFFTSYCKLGSWSWTPSGMLMRKKRLLEQRKMVAIPARAFQKQPSTTLIQRPRALPSSRGLKGIGKQIQTTAHRESED